MTSKKKRTTLAAPVKPMPRRPVAPFRHPDFTDDQIQQLTDGSSGYNLLHTLRRLDSTPGLVSPIVRRKSSDDNTKVDIPISNANATESVNQNVQGGAPNDREVLSLLIGHLVRLEAKLSEAYRQLQDKERTITHLEDQIAILQQGAAALEGNPSSVTELEQTCLRLQQQVHRMERFLADCGMIWVGEKRCSSSSMGSTLSSSDPADNELEVEGDIELRTLTPPALITTPSPTSSSPCESKLKIDYDLIIANIRDLNILAGEGMGQVCLSPEGATLKTLEPVSLTLYADGIIFCGGPFRPLNDPATHQCLQDLMDGYFPSELLGHCSVGTPIQVNDCRHSSFGLYAGQRSPASCFKSFEGSSQVTSPREPSNPFLGPALSVQQFLNSLPTTVVRDGRLLDVRSSIAQLLKGSSLASNVTVVPTKASRTNQQAEMRNKTLTTLRVHSETGSETYLMKMYSTETIGELRNYLDIYRATPSGNYEIVSLYPRRVFRQSDQTLEECGLLPNAALYLRELGQH